MVAYPYKYRPIVNTTKSTAREQTTALGAVNRGPVLSMPTAQVGSPVPFFVGKQRIAQPNVIEYKNIRGIEETTYETKEVTETIREKETIGSITRYIDKTVTKTITTATTRVIGYHVDIVIALALGPNVRLNGIYSDNEPLWTGDVGDGATGTITGGDFFLTNTSFTFHSGNFDQSPYVGIAYIVLENVRADKAYTTLQFDITRFPNPLGLTAPINRLNDDINVASAIAEVINSSWGGIGADMSVIDVPSFTAAAARLAIESNYCALLLMEETRGTDILKILQQQARGILYQNAQTGKIEFQLIRDDDIDYTKALMLAEHNIIQTRNFTKPGWQETVSQLRLTFTDRNSQYAETPVFLQNPANANYNGRGKRTATADYPTVMNGNLAAKLGARDLSLMSTPYFGLEVTANRQAASLKPGQVVFVTRKQYKLYGVPMLVRKVRKQPLTDNSVTLQLEQYRMPSSDDIYVAPVAPGPGVTEPVPTKPLAVRFITAPYYIARRAVTGLNTLTTDYGVYPMILPTPANVFQTSFATYITNVPGTPSPVQTNLEAKYTNTGQLTAPIARADGFTTGVIASLVIDGVTISNIIDTYIASGPNTTKMREGAILLAVNNEIMTFQGASKTGPTQYTLTNVRRAILDTVAGDHAANDPVYLFTADAGNLPARQFAFPPAYTPNWRIVSNTATRYGDVSDALASNAWTPTHNRTLAPLRPHGAAVDGVRNLTGSLERGAGTDITVTWRTRNRGNTDIVFQADAAEEGEIDALDAYQIHRVMIRDSGGTVHDCGATANDQTYNSLTVTIPIGAALGLAYLWVRSETVNGQSFYNDEITLTILPALAIATEDDAAFIINEAGNRYLISE